MATNLAPELVRIIVAAVIYRTDGASFDDISAALPATTPRDLRYWLSDLVAAEILDEDASTQRYFVLAGASAYLPPKEPPAAVDAAAPSPPASPQPAPGASAEPAPASSASGPARRPRRRSPRSADAAADAVTPEVAAAFREAARSLPTFVRSSTGSSPRFPGQGPSAQPSALTSVVAKLATKLLTQRGAPANSGGITRIVLGAAAVVVVLAVLQLIGSSPWLMIGAALLVIAGVLVVGAWRASAASSQASSATSPAMDSATVSEVGSPEGTPSGLPNGPAERAQPNGLRRGHRRGPMIAATACLVAGLGIVTAMWLFHRHSRPSLAEVSTYLSSNLAAIPARVVALDAVYSDFGKGSCRVTYRGIIETTEPLFRRLDATAYLHAQAPSEVTAIESAGALLRGADGARIRSHLASTEASLRLSRPTAPDKDTPGVEQRARQYVEELTSLVERRFQDVILVTTQTPARTAAACSGVLLAWRRKGGWVFTPEAARIDERVLPGSRRPDGALVFAVDFPDDAARLRAFIAEAAIGAAKVREAATVLAAEIERNRQQRIDAFANLLANGTLFSGILASAGQPESHRVVLEITDSSAATRRLSALLRNDGGWTDARLFSGEWSLAPDADACTVTLRTRREDRIDEAGPLLQDRSEWSFVLQVRPDGTAVANGAWQFRRVAAGEVEALKTDMKRAVAAAVAATQSGAVYRGTVVYRRTKTRETLVLRFVDQERDGAILRATMRPADANGPVRRFTGLVLDNSYRAAGDPIRLQSADREAVSVPEIKSLLAFQSSNGLPVTMHVDGTRLVGENKWYTYEFERVEPGAEDVARDRGVDSADGPRPGPAGEPTGEAIGKGSLRGPRSETAKTAASADPAYPTVAGAYVLSGGTWKALPGNNSRAIQKAAKGLLNLVGDLNLIGSSEARRRAAVIQNAVTEVMFSDPGPVPSAKAGEVVVVYVGQLAPPSADLVARHPELTTYPVIEMAPAKTLPTGARYASLVAIVPGYTGFGDDRVAAAIEHPAGDVTVLRSAAALTRGRYIVMAGSRAYELAVE